MLNTIAFSAVITGCLAAGPATRPAASFNDAQTFFQTNVSYDPRIAIAVDAVVVHQHGADPAGLKGSISSWQKRGFTTGRMFFADSDSGNTYTSGKWDGTPHPEDIERNARGEPVLCAGIRPYMTPTEGWIKYLEEMTAKSIDAGAEAIMPEEPLAHFDTGYEESFKKIWQERFGFPWQAENSSPAAHYLGAQLKAELYAKLERRLADVTRERARKLGREIPFILPIHSAYSSVASNLTAPLGISLDVPADGYVGQIWTGPIRWAQANYTSPDKSFFASAYALYDYFVQLVDGTDKRLWLLTDPVEDDPNHTWAEFEEWYRECVVAELMFPQVAQYEVMPWPDRIFLPGYNMGGQTPAPERFRVIVLSVVQALQEMPKGGEWCDAEGRRESEISDLRSQISNPEPANVITPAGNKTVDNSSQSFDPQLGVAVADSIMWQLPPRPCLQGIYGLLLPLIEAGVPAKACILERATEKDYLSRFKTIVVSFEVSQTPSAAANDALVKWARAGGSLVLVGGTPELRMAPSGAGPENRAEDRPWGPGQSPFWWEAAGFKSAREHLLKGLGLPAAAEGEHAIGAGRVTINPTSPTTFGDPKVAREKYFTLLGRAGKPLATPGAFCLRRGPFVIVHAGKRPVKLAGSYVDMFDPELPVVKSPEVAKGASRLYRAVDQKSKAPSLLHATHRVISAEPQGAGLRVVVRGPSETPAVLRIAAGERQYEVTARDARKDVAVDVTSAGGTLRVRFPNAPNGVTVEVRAK